MKVSGRSALPPVPAAHDDDDEQEEELEEEEADARTQSQSQPATEDRAERRRRQCRISQRRYRDKKGSMEYNLRLDINELRESVDRLKQARVLLESKIQNDRRLLRQSVLKAVEQYYAMFRFGLHDPDAGEHVRKCYEIQVSFLRAFMVPDVQMGEQSGIDIVLEQWRRYTQYHSSLEIELVSAQVFGSDTGSPIVKASGRLFVTISRTTLEQLFPQILENEAITQFLIGRQVEYTTCTEYVFDEKVQVIRQDLTVDFLTGMNVLLRDPFVMAELFSQAKITDDAIIGPHDDEAKASESEDATTSDDAATATTDESAETAGNSRLALQFIMS